MSCSSFQVEEFIPTNHPLNEEFRTKFLPVIVKSVEDGRSNSNFVGMDDFLSRVDDEWGGWMNLLCHSLETLYDNDIVREHMGLQESQF
jgi:hypothetical protein